MGRQRGARRRQRVLCSCVYPPAPGTTFGPDAPVPVCLPAALNPFAGGNPDANPNYESDIEAFCRNDVGNFIDQVARHFRPGGPSSAICDGVTLIQRCICNRAPNTALPEADGCKVLPPPVACSSSNCTSLIDEATGNIVLDRCNCQTCTDPNFCCLTNRVSPSPVVHRARPGQPDPPPADFGVLGGFLASESTAPIDAATSRGSLTVSFEDDLGFDHSDTATVALHGELRLYGRRREVGSSRFMLDFGLSADDFSLHFSGVDVVGDVTVHVGSALIGAGTGEATVEFDSAGMARIPRGVLLLQMEALVDGKKTIIRSTNPNDVLMHIDFAAKSFEIPSIAFSIAGASGHVSLRGTLRNQPPIVRAGPDQTVECVAAAGTPVTLQGSVTDADNNVVVMGWNEGAGLDASRGVASTPIASVLAPFTPPSRTTTYTLLAQDGAFQMSHESSNVTVRDTTAPTLDLVASPDCLWAPNHALVLFELGAGIEARSTDACDPSAHVRIVDVKSSQPPLGGGSGNTASDTFFGEKGLCLRSERQGTSREPRRYTITVEARDASGNSVTKSIEVRVGHDENSPYCPKVDPSRLVEDGDPRCTAN